MKIFTCTDHDGFWPVGVASVIVAPDDQHATALLDSYLAGAGLKTSKDHPFTLQELDTSIMRLTVLNDGNY